jgi:hypothetical protein
MDIQKKTRPIDRNVANGKRSGRLQVLSQEWLVDAESTFEDYIALLDSLKVYISSGTYWLNNVPRVICCHPCYSHDYVVYDPVYRFFKYKRGTDPNVTRYCMKLPDKSTIQKGPTDSYVYRTGGRVFAVDRVDFLRGPAFRYQKNVLSVSLFRFCLE